MFILTQLYVCVKGFQDSVCPQKWNFLQDTVTHTPLARIIRAYFRGRIKRYAAHAHVLIIRTRIRDVYNWYALLPFTNNTRVYCVDESEIRMRALQLIRRRGT